MAAGARPEVEVAVVEVPLLFEAGMEDAFDATVAVIADDEIRERRLAERGQPGLEGREAASARPGREGRRADHVIRNDGTLEDLEARSPRRRRGRSEDEIARQRARAVAELTRSQARARRRTAERRRTWRASS